MKFSVITVVLNDLKGLARTSASVSAQARDDLEWLVLDGGSRDGTVNWLSGVNDTRLRWWSGPDRGLYDAMNHGIDRAHGDYLLFLNAGDEFANPEVLESISAAAANGPRPDFLYGDAIDVVPGTCELYKPARSHRTLWWTMFASHQAMVFRRERVGSLRYRLTYRHAADYAFVAEFLRSDHPGGPPCVRRMRSPICRFWLGGHSWQNRRAGIREDYDIRKQHIGVPGPINAVLFVAHHVHTTLKRKVPWLTRHVRYQGRNEHTSRS